MSAISQSAVLPADVRRVLCNRKAYCSSDDLPTPRSASTPSEIVSTGDSSTPGLVQAQPRWSEIDSEDDDASIVEGVEDNAPLTAKRRRRRNRRGRAKHSTENPKLHGSSEVAISDAKCLPACGDRAAQTLATLGLLVTPEKDCPHSPNVSPVGPVRTMAMGSSDPQCHLSIGSPTIVEAPSQNLQFCTALTPVYAYQPCAMPVLAVCGAFFMEPHHCIGPALNTR